MLNITPLNWEVVLKNSYYFQVVKQNEEEESVPKVASEVPGKKQKKPKAVKEVNY